MRTLLRAALAMAILLFGVASFCATCPSCVGICAYLTAALTSQGLAWPEVEPRLGATVVSRAEAAILGGIVAGSVPGITPDESPTPTPTYVEPATFTPAPTPTTAPTLIPTVATQADSALITPTGAPSPTVGLPRSTAIETPTGAPTSRTRTPSPPLAPSPSATAAGAEPGQDTESGATPTG